MCLKFTKNTLNGGKDKKFRFTMSEDPEVPPESIAALSVKSGVHTFPGRIRQNSEYRNLLSAQVAVRS